MNLHTLKDNARYNAEKKLLFLDTPDIEHTQKIPIIAIIGNAKTGVYIPAPEPVIIANFMIVSNDF